MLGYSGYICALRSATLGAGTGPVWLTNLRCGYATTTLNNCPHSGVSENWCTHSKDAAVICQSETQIIAIIVNNNKNNNNSNNNNEDDDDNNNNSNNLYSL